MVFISVWNCKMYDRGHIFIQGNTFLYCIVKVQSAITKEKKSLCDTLPAIHCILR